MLNNDPWPHILIDDFYPTDLYNNMVEELLQYVKSSKLRDFTSRETIPEIMHTFKISKELIHTKKCLASKPITEKLIKIFPITRFTGPNSTKTIQEINICLGKSSFPIHFESPWKVLSCVCYIMPEKSTGTVLYNRDKSYHSTVEWKPNRMLVFPGIIDETWHSYETEGSFRLTINTFLCDESLNELL